MTQGLLKTVFHDPSSGGRRRDVEVFRSQLEESVFTKVGEVSGAPLMAACLPLFTKDMRQVVRFVLRGGPPGLQLRLEGAPGFWALGAGHTDVLVPEVTSSARRSFEVLAPSGEPACRGQVVLRPQRKWSVWLVHHSHLDVGYTDPQEAVLANHLQYLDSVLELADSTASWADDARFRWNIEVNWPLERWFAARGKAEQDKMVQAIREGYVSVGAMSLNLHTEACSIDELYEMARFSADLRRRYGLDIPAAMQTDVPGAVTGLVEVLSDAGVRYLSLAHNYAGRSVPYLIGGESLERPFYWRSPSGKRLLVWYTDTLHGNAYMEGNIAGATEPYPVALSSLPCYLAALAEQPYPFTSGIWLPEASTVRRDPYPHDILHLRVQGHYGDNAPPNIAVSALVREWGSHWSYPRLRVARNEEFFEAATERLGEGIASWQGDWADWWADGLGSGARALRWAREAQQATRDAETLSALGDLLAGKAPAPPSTRHIYQATGLFDEHTWGARHPWEDDEEGWGSGQVQWQHKASFAEHAREEARALAAKAARQAGLKATSPAGPCVVVFNTAGWPRTDVVRAFVPFSVVPEGKHAVLQDERDGRPLATLEAAQEHLEHRPAGRFLTFLAQDVPPFGYARFRLVEGSPAATEPVKEAWVLRNEHYRVALSPGLGTISSVTDLASGTELVNQEALFGFNAYVFDRYGTAPRVDHLSGRVFSRALDLVAARETGRAAVVVSSQSSELGETLTVEVLAPGCSRLLSTVTLWRSLRRVEISNRLWKLPTKDKESVFFAFPFALADPEVSYELPGVATRAAAPQVPGSPRHMRAVRHWVSLATASSSVAWASLDAPLVQFGDIHSPYCPYPGTLPLAGPEPATIYSWALNNIWDTNFPPVQGGEMRFSYALSSEGPSASPEGLASRLAESVSAPLVAVVAPQAAQGPASAPSGSFCSIDRPEVRLLKASGSAQELLLWLNNIGPDEAIAEIAFPGLAVSGAKLATVFGEGATELTPAAGAVRARLGAGETRVLALRLEGAGPQGTPG